ncbi:MAG: enoyl-CoA hydratase [Pseudomonadota bacterium]
MSTTAPVTDNDEPLLLNTLQDGVRYLTLNRPRQFNPLSENMLTALRTALDEAGDDAHTRVIVVGANGKAFCAGHDLREMRSHHGQDYYETLFQQCSGLMQALVEIPKPVIAAVQGIATAAGCQLVAQCDLAVAAESAQFAVSGVNLGLFCSTPSVALSRNVARKKAFEMLVTGQFISADKALEYGLVNRVAPDDALLAEVKTLTDAITAKPAVAIETGKRMFYQQIERNLEGAYAYAGEVMACNMMAADTVEGVDAFLEKRPPRW